ncbi:MAG: 3-methyl-2-oxobutanoate hydroxymethyltransferase [Candidatus Omnitrophica bacterium]|nr:3-methyl-2-oxobutanoate hydroxymethyltransferase [Candidatus Omnitrophota bacterium]
MITAYDSLTANAAVNANADILLVGDSVATVCLGYESTAELTFDEFKHHVNAVLRKSKDVPVVADITYDLTQSNQNLLDGADYLMRRGCGAVKLEFSEFYAEQTRLLTDHQIPVIGHIGITPQTTLNGQPLKALGKTDEETDKLLHAAGKFQDAGASMLVVECVVAEAVNKIRETVSIPLIGIGSGMHCDGQVLVFHDIIGWNNGFKAKFTRAFFESEPYIEKALQQYVEAVHNSEFPTELNTYRKPGK